MDVREKYSCLYSWARAMYNKTGNDLTVNPIGLSMYIARNDENISLDMSDMYVLKCVCDIAYTNRYKNDFLSNREETRNNTYGSTGWEWYVRLKRALLGKYKPEKLKKTRRIIRRGGPLILRERV